MKASELRIGNYCHYKMNNFHIKINDLHDVRKEWLELCIIDVGDLNMLINNPHDPDFIPIEINQQWLIDFGFELDESDNYKIESVWYNKILHNENEISVNFKIKLFTIGLNIEWINPIKIEYVHDLQNIYFALTGIELTKKI